MRSFISAFLLAGLSAATPAKANGEIAYLASTGDYWQVWVVDATGSEPRQVTRSPYEKVRCSWYPDGRQLLVNSLDGRLLKVHVRDGSEEEIGNVLPGTKDAVISPTGRWIAFSLSTAGSVDDNEIWVVDADGGNPRRLTRMPWLQHDPAWSPDERFVYFASGDGGQAHDLWRVEVETGSREQLTVGSLYHFDVDVAGDEHIAFSNNQTGNYELYARRGRTQPRRLTDHPALDAAPSWSPEGDALVFHSTRSGALNVWRLDLASDAPVQLTFHKAGARDPSWAPRAGGTP